MNKQKKIAIITMARNDNFFLEKWIRYYGEQIGGEEHVYVYLDGKDQQGPHHSGKAHVIYCDKLPGTIREVEPQRLSYLSDRAAELFKEGYEIVIGCDADEYIVVEPTLGKTLGEYLTEKEIGATLSGLGLDMGQRLGEESVIDGSTPFLGQRMYGILEPDYSKPCIITKPVRWGVGFHRVRGKNFHIDEHLYLFHFGSFDLKMIEDKIKDKDTSTLNLEKHIRFRRRVIDRVSEVKKPKDGERWFKIARVIETLFRAPYHWNRPSMLGQQVVVRIPERFRGIV